MQHVRLKGIASATKRLADGTKRTYCYAWRGGPKLDGEPGTPEFIASYNEAAAKHLEMKRAIEAETKQVPVFAEVIDTYEGSHKFRSKAEKTRKDYQRYLDLIRAKFGTLPINAFNSPKVRGVFMDWRDTMADKPRTADYAWSVLARLCAYGLDRGDLPKNPCLNGGRLYVADRNENIWTEEHILQLFAVASAEVRAVVTFALWTGQRQGDCLQAQWSALDGQRIRVRQAKGGARVLIPIGAPLAELIEELPQTEALTILTDSRGQAWTGDGFRASFGAAVRRAGIEDDLHFHDLRGTAVTRMALAGSTALQIAAVTGHSTKTVDEILAAHYLGGRVELAEQAIRQLEKDAEMRQKLQTGEAKALLEHRTFVESIEFA